MAKTSAAANAFGAGSELIGKSHRGHEIVSASRRFMHLDNGDTVSRKGARVDYEYDPNAKAEFEADNSSYMTDDL